MTSRQAMPAITRRDDRGTDRRQGGRGGRRRTDQGIPWWQKGLVLATLCAVLRWWRVFRPAAARRAGQDTKTPS
jgi:hypothetical protein